MSYNQGDQVNYIPSAPVQNNNDVNNIPTYYPVYPSINSIINTPSNPYNPEVNNNSKIQNLENKTIQTTQPINLNININRTGRKKYKKSESDEYETMSQKNMNTTLDMYRKYEQEEIIDFAVYLGVDVVKYPFTLKYVLEAMHTPLPKYWEEKISDDGEKFFYHKKLFISSWNHPLDSFYREYIADEIKRHKKKRKQGCNIL
tara:strand:- start:174 stop:779 length:606 start_codon:yes stop_codon:yes gene_type:complete